MQITIKHNFPNVQRQIDALREDIARKATASALNKTIALAKTAMSKEIRAEFVLSASEVNQALFISKASAKGGELRMQASLSSTSQRGKRSLNVAHFAARQTRKGVSFKISRNGGRKTIPGSFLINGGKTVMIRTGKSRLPIKAIQTIDVAQMFNTKRINVKVTDMIKSRFPDVFEHEAKFFTDRFNGLKAA